MVAGVYRLALPARIVLFVFVSGVLGLVPDPCARFRSAHASRAPPGLGCFMVVMRCFWVACAPGRYRSTLSMLVLVFGLPAVSGMLLRGGRTIPIAMRVKECVFT